MGSGDVFVSKIVSIREVTFFSWSVRKSKLVSVFLIAGVRSCSEDGTEFEVGRVLSLSNNVLPLRPDSYYSRNLELFIMISKDVTETETYDVVVRAESAQLSIKKLVCKL